ncbi:uncharacterized protein LOC119675345 [Teleopsis dalmanni]|uniref:uncharacterized protein LOC119675345 n=1 Tax=Teleopsis dalmanni TaxID=139649 RepID=UPI0018CD147C|nr:uncharacterized protein LOC119675345 [Teleopsis dalmanni]
MTEIDIERIMSPHYFIPHHCVLKPDSTTTKLRVVFDASSKTTSGQSLNDLLHIGPTVQSELLSILLRFRLPRYVFTTDIEKMYRQILVYPEDRQCQLIVWRNEPSQPIKYFQLNTVTYGTRSAPYLATKCLQVLADDNMQNYPLGASALKQNFYVDDCLHGADSLRTLLETQSQLNKILTASGFKLRKWCANHPSLLQGIPHDDLKVNLDLENNNDTTKTLGLSWCPKSDSLCVKVKLEPVCSTTKRSATSDLARLFDPLGLLSPVVVMAKIFIQELWNLKMDWDEKLPTELQKQWLEFRNNLTKVKPDISSYFQRRSSCQHSITHLYRCIRKGIWCCSVFEINTSEWSNHCTTIVRQISGCTFEKVDITSSRTLCSCGWRRTSNKNKERPTNKKLPDVLLV